MTLFIILFFLLLLVPDACIWYLHLRPSWPLWAVVLWWLPTAAALAASIVWATGHMSAGLIKFFFAILMCFALPKFVFMLFALVGAGVGVRFPQAATAVVIAGALVAAALSACSVYGFAAGTKRLETREVEVRSPRLPLAFDGYRIIHISDLHVGTFGGDSRFLAELVARANALDGDAVVFTGDIVNSSAAELEPYLGVLARLHGRDGVYSVLGNHDYCEYARYDTPDGAARNTLRVIEAECGAGWRVLMNEHAEVVRGADTLTIAGVENVGRPPFPSRGDLAKALDGAADGYTVLLSHDPSHWRREVLPSSSVDLMLAGHTHAMQFELFGFSPSAWTYPEWGGLYTEGARALHVSKGAGGTAPFRFGAWPEITVITLRKTE